MLTYLEMVPSTCGKFYGVRWASGGAHFASVGGLGGWDRLCQGPHSGSIGNMADKKMGVAVPAALLIYVYQRPSGLKLGEICKRVALTIT
jgi:hypothetical protein